MRKFWSICQGVQLIKIDWRKNVSADCQNDTCPLWKLCLVGKAFWKAIICIFFSFTGITLYLFPVSELCQAPVNYVVQRTIEDFRISKNT